MKEETLVAIEQAAKNLYSWIVVILVGASALIFSMGFRLTGFLLLLATVLGLIFTTLHYYKKRILLERHSELFEQLHEIIHKLRDEMYTNQMRDALTNVNTRNRIFVRCIRIVSDGISRVFSGLVGRECTASVMYPKEVNGGRVLKTAGHTYSVNTPLERKSRFSNPLAMGQGFAGKSILDGHVRWSNDLAKESEYVPVRDDWAEHYNSVITSPFKVNGEYAGILNVDCRKKGAFRKEMRYLVQAAGDLMALLHQWERAKIEND